MFDAKTIRLAESLRPDLDFSVMGTEEFAILKIIENATGGGVVPVYDADISNGIASFSGVTKSKPLVSLKLNIPVTQTGSGTASPDNIRDIVGVQGVNVSRTGKNLCPPVIMNLNYDPITGEETTSNITASSIKFPFDKDKTYVFTKNCNVNSMFLAWDAQGNYVGRTIGNNNSPRTFSKTSFASGSGTKDFDSIAKIAVRFYQSDKQNIDDVIDAEYQVEVGNTATPYEEYTGQSVTVNLGQTVYKGELDVLTGILTVTHKLATFDGSEKWTKSTTYNGGYYISGWVAANSVNYSHDHYQNIARTVWTSIDYESYDYVCFFESALNFKVDGDLYPTLADFKNFLSQNNLKVLYPLATPIEIQLTPTQIINTLIGENVIFADVADVTECKYKRK